MKLTDYDKQVFRNFSWIVVGAILIALAMVLVCAFTGDWSLTNHPGVRMLLAVAVAIFIGSRIRRAR